MMKEKKEGLGLELHEAGSLVTVVHEYLGMTFSFTKRRIWASLLFWTPTWVYDDFFLFILIDR